MRIILLRTWITNIGNGFIDKGGRIALKRARPNADIIEVSGYPNFAADEMALGNVWDVISKPFNFDLFRKEDSALGNVANISDFIDADLAVLPGCVLTAHALRKYMPVLIDLHQRNIPIILLGAGGGVYTDSMRQYVRTKFEQFQPTALLSRDAEAYKFYQHEVDYSYNGIDCAYFINDWYTPPELDEDLLALTFDKHEEPQIEFSGQKIRPHHQPFGWPFQGIIKSIFRPEGGIFNPKRGYKGILKDALTRPFSDNFFGKNNAFFSDRLKDYLMIYANVSQTHSDRVHACLPTMVYGGKAKFYHTTPRAGLFEEVTNSDINTELTGIDRGRLEKKKKDQVSAIDKAIDKSV